MNKIMSIFNVIQSLRQMPSSVSNTCPPLSFAVLSIIGNLLRILLLLLSNVDLDSCLLFLSNGTVELMLKASSAMSSIMLCSVIHYAV